MLTQTQIRQILTNWNIEDKLEIGPVHHAGGKGTWQIGSDYILKTGRNIAGLKTHIAISKALAQSGMDAAYPIPTKAGADFLLDDDRYYVLTNKVSGSYLGPQERYRGDRFSTGVKYGEAIAGLHKILKNHDTSIEVNDSNLLETVLIWALPNTKRIMEQWNMPLPEEFYRNYQETFSQLYPLLPRHIIHRDPNPSNIMFANSEVTGFIDFVISERNVRLFDPCYCATGILSEAGNIAGGYEKWPEIFAGIISGYDRLAKLTAAEKQAVPYVVYSIQMIFIAWLEPHDELKDIAVQNRNMLDWLWKNRQIFA